MTPPLAPPGGCNAVLDSFLQDMEALDHQGEVQVEMVTRKQPKKRSLEAAVERPTADSRASVVAKKKRLIPSWLKRKTELQTLRQQTQAMETRVVYLEMKKADPSGEFSALEVKTRALVEKQRRQVAQDENERLKAQLHVYTGKLQAVQTALTAAESQRSEVLSAVWAFARGLRVEMGTGRQLHPCSAELFNMLERRMDGRFHELEGMMRVMQEPMLSVDTQLVETNCNHGERAVEFTRLELLPFEEEIISSTMWSFIEMGRFPDGEHSIVARRSDDVFAVTSRVAVQVERSHAITIDTHSVMKRFVVPRGVAFMVESCSEWTANLSASSTWSHTTRERGCFVMRSYAGASPGICQARSVLRLNPGEAAKDARCYPLAKSCAINEVVIPSFRQLVNARHQFVHNSLFDTIRRRK